MSVMSALMRSSKGLAKRALVNVDRDNLVGLDPTWFGIPRRVGDVKIDREQSWPPLEARSVRRGDRADDHRPEPGAVHPVGGDDKAGANALLLAPLAGVQVHLPDLAAQRDDTTHGAPPPV